MSDASGESFEPVNMVERQLVAAAQGNAEAQKAFERFILDETLFVATPEARPEGIVTLKADATVQLLNVSLNDGRKAVAIFTSPERVHTVFGSVGYLGIPGRALLEMVRTQPAILNPGQPFGVVWEPESLSAMIGLPVERVIEKDTQFLLGSPSDPPAELIERLKAALGDLPEVAAAWLGLAAWGQGEQQSWYLDVRTSGPDNERIRRTMAAAVDGSDMKGFPLDMVIKSPQDQDGTGIVIVSPRQQQPGVDDKPVRSAKKNWLSWLFN